MRTAKRLQDIYNKLYNCYGPQGWWPAETPFEVMVGAILTQNTNWLNVEKAIRNIKLRNLMDPVKLCGLTLNDLSILIKPAGYYNVKAERLKNFLNFLCNSCKADIKVLKRLNTNDLREKLLGVKGVGKETADSIMLYALEKPIFVVDAYTRRVLFRHGMISEEADYDEIQALFMENLSHDVPLFNEFHALLVRVGKERCRTNPTCNICSLSPPSDF